MSNALKGSDSGRQSKSNEHHNIPCSRGGSDHDVNISDVPKSRHADFHQWASNRDPGQLARYIALHSLGKGESSIGNDRLNTLFQITTLLQWSNLYDAHAFRPSVDVSGYASMLTAFAHFKTQIMEEIVWVRKTIETLNGNGDFPTNNHTLLPLALGFFGTKSPGKAIEGLMTEEHYGMLSWVKPMKTETRDAILATVRTHKGRNDSKENTLSILGIQEKHLVHADKLIDKVFSLNGIAFEPPPEPRSPQC